MHKAGQVTAAAQWSAYSNEKYKQRQGVLISHEPTGGNTSGAWFIKYLTTILRLSYDNAKVTINLQNILQWKESLL